MARWVALLTVAGAIGAGIVAVVPDREGTEGSRRFRLGVVAATNGWGERVGEEQQRVVRLGVRWIREELAWAEDEPQPGRFDWRSNDRLMASAARAGLRVLPMLLGTPAWAGDSPAHLPRDERTFARYVAAVTRRYGPGGTFWRRRPERERRFAPRWFELWNEPHLPFFSAGGVDPGRYGRLALAAARAGRAANPRTRYLVAADLVFRAGERERPWVPEMLAGAPGLAEAVDGIAVHPYTARSPRRRTRRPQDDFRRIDLIRRAFADAGRPDLPLWITEIGWSTCSDAQTCVDRRRQARYVDELLRLARDRGSDIAAVFLYHLRDGVDADPAERERNFGLLDGDGRPKPAYWVVHCAARGQTGCRRSRATVRPTSTARSASSSTG